MKIRPLQNRIIVRRDAAAATIGTIVIPETAKEKPVEGTVLAVGPAATGIHAGDRIMFGQYAGTEIKIDGIDHLMMTEDDVMGVVTA